MKYGTDEAFEEIKRRGKEIKKKHDRHVTEVLSVASTVTTFALIIVLGMLCNTGVNGKQTDYGSFIISAEAGGYVLTAVVAFVLGAVATFMVLKYKNRDKSSKES